jgi:hypothetical protein
MSRVDGSPIDNWEKTSALLRSRKGVLFLSYCRFWERHAFVQQSIAREIAKLGVPVLWFDGAGWRNYSPVVLDPMPGLVVRQLPQLPLTRLPFVAAFDRARKLSLIQNAMKRLGGNPLIWVEAGVEESLAERLPYVDVFSVFDDPYRHSPSGALCRKAKAVICQNQTAAAILQPLLGSKVHCLLPPVDMSDQSVLGTAEVFLPQGFPSECFGYVGSFFSDGFDFDLFEQFIRAFPERGFILMGRTDLAGTARLAEWKRYPNFHYFPWVPRAQVAAVWKRIRVTLLFYRQNPTQDGAFPVKVVESLRFGVPCIATKVPKTQDLEGVFPRGETFEELVACLNQAMAMKKEQLEPLYAHFAAEMEPRSHLSKVLQWSSH